MADAPLLVYDGVCGFCARAVRFLLRHDRRRRTVRFATRDGAYGLALRQRHPSLAHADSLFWVEGDGSAREVVRTHSDAALAAARYLGGGWAFLAGVGGLVPRPLRDAVYRLIARNRHRLAPATCVVFTAEERGRLLD